MTITAVMSEYLIHNGTLSKSICMDIFLRIIDDNIAAGL